MSIINDIVSFKIYDKRDGFNFEIVNFLFLDGDVPRPPSYGICFSHIIRFARVCYNVDDKIRKTFSNFYHRYSELIVKYNIGPIFYGDLVHKFERIDGI